jgi:undecaprenyl-diphosphatase
VTSQPVGVEAGRKRLLLVDGRLRKQLRGVLILDLLLMAVLAALAWRSSTPDRVDVTVARALYAERGSILRAVTDVVSVLGEPLVVVALSAIVAAWAWRHAHDRVLALFSPVAVGATSLVGHLLKLLVERTRPPTAVFAHELDFSYPSGHATGATALALTIILLALALRARHRHALIALATGYAVAICLSRLVLGVHFLTDIVGAVALAGAGVLVIGWLCTRRR